MTITRDLVYRVSGWLIQDLPNRPVRAVPFISVLNRDGSIVKNDPNPGLSESPKPDRNDMIHL